MTPIKERQRRNGDQRIKTDKSRTNGGEGSGSFPVFLSRFFLLITVTPFVAGGE
jgi:hypothetical protein